MEKFYYLPLEQINDQEVIITCLCFNSGDFVKKDQIIYSFETAKSNFDVEAKEDGFIFYSVEEGQTIKIGSLVCVISSDQNYEVKSDIKGSIGEVDKGDKRFRLTKPAKEVAEKYQVDVNSLGLRGIVRKNDILRHVNRKSKKVLKSAGKIVRLNVSDSFVQYLMREREFRTLSSEEKIKRYREHGHFIGENVQILEGAVLIGNFIKIYDNVVIGENSYIEAPEITIEENTMIGSRGNFVASQISIGPYTRFADHVQMDISGGRYPDSRFICGKGCLIASEVYINVCRQVELGEHVALSPKAMIFTHSYWQSILEGYSARFGPVTFGDDSWLGATSQVLPNVSIGEGSIVMSGSVVVSNVNSFTLVGGVPSSVIRKDIKKQFPRRHICELLKNVFNEIATYLSWDGFDVDVVSETEFNVVENSKIRNVKLILQNGEALEKYDIVILLGENIDIVGKTNEAFLIEEKSAVGSLSPLGQVLIDLFRKQGILFYPKGE